MVAELCRAALLLGLFSNHAVGLGAPRAAHVSPTGTYTIEIVAPQNGRAGKIALREAATSATVASVALTSAPVDSKSIVLWNKDSSAVAIRIAVDKKETSVIAFTKTPSGIFKSSEPSRFTGNAGKLGEPLNHWDRIENEPIEWSDHPSSPGARFLNVRTRFWDKGGKRFSANELVFISADGEPLQR